MFAPDRMTAVGSPFNTSWREDERVIPPAREGKVQPDDVRGFQAGVVWQASAGLPGGPIRRCPDMMVILWKTRNRPVQKSKD